MSHPSRFENLDAARALAALLVVVMHVSENWARFDYSTHVIGPFLINLSHTAHFGSLGVNLFFLISGFVIPYSVSRSGITESKGFLLRRFFRIYPLYLLNIPLGVMTTFWLWGKEFSVYDGILNALMVPNFFGRPFAEGLYWTLQVELLFYIICAVFISRADLRRISVAWVFLAVSALYFIAKKLLIPPHPIAILIFYLAGVRFILLGWLIRKFFESGKISWIDKALLLSLLVYYLLFMPYQAFHLMATDTDWMNSIIETLALLLFMFFLYLPVHLHRLAYIGRISYSIYLMHPVVMYIIYRIAGYPIGSIFAENDLVYSLILIIIITIAVSHLTWKWVEMPFQRLGREWMRKS
ncbi:MAG: acyltransferase [Chlorobiaceae bacterium]|nr:acyltransferase [Chlorobiaceae bacterium]